MSTDDSGDQVCATSCITYSTADALTVFGYIHLAGVLCRVVLLCVAYKEPASCKAFFYYELLMLLLAQCSSTNLSLAGRVAARKLNVVSNLVLFLTLYYNFWLSLAATILTQFLSHIIQELLSDTDEQSSFIFNFGKDSFWLLLMLIPSHMLVTYTGFQYTENECKNFDREELLEGLEEGLLVVNHQHQLLYKNEAVQSIIDTRAASALPKLGQQPKEAFPESALKQVSRFVNCNKALSWTETADYQQTITALTNLSNFEKLSQIVANEAEKGPDSKA